jgi:membrane-bound lytic murein transglycosylase MltF
VALNERFVREGKPPVKIEPLPGALEDEDILEMVNAGVLDLAVVDSWKLKIWKQVLPRITVRQDVVLRNDGKTGWAIRHQSPKLQTEIGAFFKSHVSGGNLTYRVAQYQKRVKQIADNTHGKSLKRFESTVALFQKYGQKYDFDPLMLVAQGFQESRLDQTARSPAGAVGVMQVLPATGAELKVGNVENLEPNIHAGAKYMNQIMTRYFSDAHFTQDDRTLFAFASYNAGPATIAKMRTRAEKDGLDSNVWFDNVELEAARWIGLETTTYVRNIFKYYSAYKLTLEAKEEARKARETVPAR